MRYSHVYIILVNIEKMKEELCKTYDYFNLTLDLDNEDVLYNTITEYSEDIVMNIFLNQPTIFPPTYYVDDVIMGINDSDKLLKKLRDTLKLQNEFIAEQSRMIHDIANMNIVDIIESYYNIDTKIPEKFENVLNIFNVILGKPDVNSLCYDTVSSSYTITQNMIEKVEQSPEEYAIAIINMS